MSKKREDLTHIMSKLRATLFDFVEISDMSLDRQSSFNLLIRWSTYIAWEQIKKLITEV